MQQYIDNPDLLFPVKDLLLRDNFSSDNGQQQKQQKQQQQKKKIHPPLSELQELQLHIDEVDRQYSPTASGIATITRVSNSTVVATREEAVTLPLANKRTQAADIGAIRNRLHVSGLKQFNNGIAAAFHPDRVCGLQPDANITMSHGTSVEALERVRNEGTIERVTPEQLLRDRTKSCGKAFFRREQKENTDGELIDRVRFLFWPKRHNDALKSSASSYESNVHMSRASDYISAIQHEGAVVGDITSGFTHIQIPEECRAWFRFMDENGNVWQMCVLPMGLVPSCQIMEVLTLALIGSPIVCKPDFVLHGVDKRGYVDDFRIAGSKRRCLHAIDVIKHNAAELKITIKSELAFSTTPTFLGVCYNHVSKSVTISKKTLSKLPSAVPETMTAGLLYRTVARLIFCSGPLDINIGRFYFTMKHATSICNKVNRGLMDDEHVLKLPNGLRASLARWIELVHRPAFFAGRDWTARAKTPKVTLYTDASLAGWGAVLINSAGAVYVVGGQWNDSKTLKSSDISWLEARAVRYAMTAFRDIIERHKTIQLRIDNTSVVAAYDRGRGRAAAIHVEVIETIEWLREKGITVRVAYIESAKNPADCVSRNKEENGVVRQVD